MYAYIMTTKQGAPLSHLLGMKKWLCSKGYVSLLFARIAAQKSYNYSGQKARNGFDAMKPK